MGKSLVNNLQDIKKGLEDIINQIQKSCQMPSPGQGNGQGQGQGQGNGQGNGQGQGQGSGQGNGQGQGNQSGQNNNGKGGSGQGQGQGPRSVDDMLNGMGAQGEKIKEVRKHLHEKASSINVNGTQLDISKDNIRDIKINKNDEGKSAQTVENTIDGIIEIAKSSKEWGNEHCGGLRKLVEEMSKNYVNWLQFLKHFLKRDRSKDKTYYKYHKTRVFRMTGGEGPILRGNKAKKERLRGLLIGIDTSGSINDDLLAHFIGDVKGLLKEHPHIQGHLIYWGTEVASGGEFKTVKDIDNIEIGYGGGTDVNCVFEYAKEHPEIKHIAIYTDGYFSLEGLEKYANKWKPVIWILRTKEDYDNFKAPFGYKCI